MIDSRLVTRIIHKFLAAERPSKNFELSGLTRRYKIRSSLVPGLLCIALFNLSCGYKVASRNRVLPDISSVAILPLVNATSTFALEQILTRALVREFIEKTSFRVLRSEAGADAVLQGTLSRIRANPVTFGTSSFGTTFQVTLIGSIVLQEKSGGRTIYQNDRFTFREEYVINTDVANFFSEANPALERIARDFASSVVASVLEGQ